MGFADEWTTYWPFGALEPIRASLGLSYAEMGVAVGSLTAGGLLGHFFRIAADFVDRRWLVAGGAAGIAAGMLGFGLGQSLPVLAAAGFVWGASSDAFLVGGEVALVDLCPDDLPVALARVNALGAVGDLLAPLTLAGALALGLSWRVVFVVGAAFMLLYAGLAASQRFPKRQAEPPEPPLKAVWSVLRDPRVLLLAAIDGLHALLDEPLLGFWNAFLERIRGWTPAAATALISLTVAAGLVGYLCVPLVRRWLQPRAEAAGCRRGGPLLATHWSGHGTAAGGRRQGLPLLARIVAAARARERGQGLPLMAGLVAAARAGARGQGLPLFAGLVAASLGVAVFVPAAAAAVAGAALFGFSGAVFYSLVEAAYLGLRPGQAGTTGAVVSAIGFAGIGFPALAGWLSDMYGLAAGMALYAAVPAAVLALTVLYATKGPGSAGQADAAPGG